ncbi:AAA family ATPase [Microbacterium sp. 2FI]|uniref:AAA family ATPase n=1 Tax=Microbacterium sp. 2FI TaxID=2502193 RepID=UPI0014858FEF|nr:AAA family ATPase [Microbacterium sp. 2FI]
MLVVISGLPGTGKTAVATEVARELDAVHLSIDTVEDALLGAGLPRSWTTGVAAYEAVRAAAEQNLTLGRMVVVDAVNDSEAARDTWRRAAATTGAELIFALLSLDDEVEHRRRLEGRSRNLTNVREPSWDDVRSRAATFEPWVDEPLRVSADGSLQQIAAVILARLRG